MQRISGNKIRKEILNELTLEISNLKQSGITPSLTVVIVGDDPASRVYVNNKKKCCEQIGIASAEIALPATTSFEELSKVIKDLNHDPKVHGILCQSPLPKQCKEDEIIKLIDPAKDVDCFHPYNLGLLCAGTPSFMPCTPFGVLQMLKRSDISTVGKKVVVIGRSNMVGRPLSVLLSLKGWDATTTLCHSRTQNLPEVCRQADILVAAIGRPQMITEEYVKEGAVVIDVGINQVNDESHPKGSYLVGDVAYDQVKEKTKAITPVPGGVGPMTIAMLMYNTINAARMQNDLKPFEL